MIPLTHKVVAAVGVILAVAIGVRVAYALLAPMLPALVGLFVAVVLATWLLRRRTGR